MKHILLLCSGIFIATSFHAQNSKSIRPAVNLGNLKTLSVDHGLSMEKTTLCVDTLRYTQSKEQILGTNTFFTLPIWQSDAEAMTMTYLHSGSALTINGVEFFGANNTTDGVATSTVRASIYNVNASYTPTTLLGSATAVVTSTTANYYYVTFSTPITVTGNYAVVLDVTNTFGVFDVYVNNAAPGQSYDETLARFKSNYYPNSAGSYVTIPTLTTGDVTNFPSGPHNFDPIVAPLVSYTITTTALAAPDPVCVGSQVTFTGTAGPTSMLTSRFTNYQIFRTFFGTSANDSTRVWDFDDASPLAWINANATHTYTTAGTYDATFYTLGGFWNSCLDFATDQITVNALPTVTAGATPTTICNGSSTTLSQGGANTYVWNNGLGAVTSPSVAPTTNTTYQVTGTDANGCTNTATVAITVNPLVDATFNYASSTVCLTSSNISPTATNLGTFSATPAGLTFVSTATGEIDIAASAAGTYTVTNTTTGTCPDVKTTTLTLTNAPSANFSYAAATYCSADADPVPSFGSGASAGSFSASPSGLSVNTSNGTVDLSASTAGTYTVTNNIPAGGGCPAASATFSVAVTETPVVNSLTNISVCSGTAVPQGTITVTPVSATIGWTNSASSIGLAANGTGSIPAFTATNTGTTPVTATIFYGATNGTCVSTPVTYTITVNANPATSIASVSPACSNDPAITLVGTPTGGTFSGTGVTSNQFDPAAAAAGTHVVTYTFVDGNGCTGMANTSIVVNAEPTVTLGAFSTVCLQSASFALTGGLPAGGSYTGTGVTGGNFNPATAGVGSQTVVYSYIDANNCTSAASQSIVVEDCAGLDDLETVLFTVMPNPATDAVMITANENVVIHIVSVDGKVVVANKALTANTTETLSVDSFARGMYYIQVAGKKLSSVQPIVLN